MGVLHKAYVISEEAEKESSSQLQNLKKSSWNPWP